MNKISAFLVFIQGVCHGLAAKEREKQGGKESEKLHFYSKIWMYCEIGILKIKQREFAKRAAAEK